MLRDARELEDGARVECDLCVVGGGAAGITVARAFAGSSPSARVCLVEAGGLEYEEATQALYRGRNVGLPYFALDVSRLRYFGGSTNHWAGRCRPLDPIDYRARPWVPLSGWPFGPEELEPYYRQAHEICQLGPYRYDAAFWADEGLPLLPSGDGPFESGVWHFSPPTLFGEVYGPELKRAANVHVLLHANAIEIETDEGGAGVTGLSLACLDGPRLTVRARAYVLACGGLETPRLMLASNRVVPAGVGNRHDLVGRCFMEHPHVVTGAVALTNPDASLAFYARDRVPGHGAEFRGRLHLAESAQEAERVGNLEYVFLPEPSTEDTGYAALRRLLRGARTLTAPDDLLGDLALAVADIDDVVAGLLWRLGLRDYTASSFGLYAYAEQRPNPDSRVLLGTERDALGMPRIRLDWRLTPEDKRTLLVGAQLVAREFGRTGLGRVQIREWLTADETSWPNDLFGGHHHMGTTRMDGDPRRGVVDAECRVHGVDNLYVAGSSVFPTSGVANPTLTIVALALRLADHLQGSLSS